MALASQLNRCQKSSLLQQHEAEGAGVCQSLDMPKLLILVKFNSNPKLSSAFSAPAVVTRQVPGIGLPGWFNALEEDRRVVQAGVVSCEVRSIAAMASAASRTREPSPRCIGQHANELAFETECMYWVSQ